MKNEKEAGKAHIGHYSMSPTRDVHKVLEKQKFEG